MIEEVGHANTQHVNMGAAPVAAQLPWIASDQGGGMWPEITMQYPSTHSARYDK